ncbi:MAG: AIPR family protein [Thermodesulfobacteriota bacterium]
MAKESTVFRRQIKEDIAQLQEALSWDNKIKEDEFAFNYWVLVYMYNVDENIAHEQITDRNDKSIDCYAYYEDNDELFLIQNKYYSDDTPLSARDLGDFLSRPLAVLREGKYTRDKTLQEIFNSLDKKEDYRINLHFFVTNEKESDDFNRMIKDHNKKDSRIQAQVFFLNGIRELYYIDKSFKKNPNFQTTFTTVNDGTCLSINPSQLGLRKMHQAFYVMTPVKDIYNLWKKAEGENFPLFEENIREYLGRSVGVNRRIIKTLEDPENREKFFYYNNGITVLCSNVEKTDSGSIEVTNPQIVNGCQTVNSIAEVLKNQDNIEEDFKEVFVMTKVLSVNQEENENSFYRDIVKYTNSQNAINERYFGATSSPFYQIQENLKKKGLLLIVKQSDKNTFKEYYKGANLSKQIHKANENAYGIQFSTLGDLQITLEHLLQSIGAFKRDAHFAYTKKSQILNPTKSLYEEFSQKVHDELTSEDMVKIICLYKRSEKDRKSKDPQRFPVAYYTLNILGVLLETKSKRKISDLSEQDVDELYNFVSPLSEKYYAEYKEEQDIELNQMIKRQVEKRFLERVITDHINGMREHNPDKYKRFQETFGISS